MHKFLVIALASTVLTTAEPVVATQTAQAASLFEALFPRAAKRRKERRAREFERQRRAFKRQRAAERARARKKLKKKRAAVPIKKAKIKGPGFKTYVATRLVPVKVSALAKSFSAYDQKLLAEDALKKVQPNTELENPNSQLPDSNDDSASNADPVSTPLVLASSKIEKGEELSPIAPIRLSAVHKSLKSVRVFARKKLGKAMIAHYKKEPVFLWVNEAGEPSQKAKEVLAVLADAEAYGLRADDYSVSTAILNDDLTLEAKLKAAAAFEFELTAAALRYLSDARNGLVNPNRISGYHDFSGLSTNYGKAIAKVAATANPAAMLVEAHPKEAAFDALKASLADARSRVEGFDAVTIAPGTFIRPGQTNDQVINVVESIRRKATAELRSDHFDVFAVDHSSGEYTAEVAAMVRDFQKSVGLKPDGIVGKNTIARMQADDPNIQLKKVLLAMERLRWHPDQLGNRHVFINQPQYTASFMVNGKPQVSMRAVVGKPSNQTYFFKDEIEYVEFNPYWGIPRSILVNEYLPKLRRNSAYLDQRGYEITNQRGKRISSSSVNWNGVGANFPYNVRQPPSSKNALGELKIMFPNKHSIYMHDTPAKSLFKRSQRAFSHGCVRLAEPRVMAAAVLGTQTSQIGSYIADGENKQRRLKSKIPVYVSYFTAWPDANGEMHFYRDIYGRDKALEKAMALEEKARASVRAG